MAPGESELHSDSYLVITTLIQKSDLWLRHAQNRHGTGGRVADPHPVTLSAPDMARHDEELGING